MSFQKDSEGRRQRKSGEGTPSPNSSRSGKKKDVGRALRSAYQRVIEEDIPPDLLDLIGKLD